MTERSVGLSEEALKFGLLLEAAQTQQRSVDESLDRLQAHTRGLDGVVRDELRRTLIDELQGVTAATARAVQALNEVKRAVALRTALVAAGLTGVTAAISTAAVWWTVPSARDIEALRAEKAGLERNVADLVAQGGRIEWARCGDARRLCVRVERKAAFGKNADYRIAKGY